MWNRRRFLQLLGASAGGLILPSGGRLGYAATGDAPKRLIVLVSSLGFEPRSLRMAPPGGDESILLPSLDPELGQTVPDTATWDFSLVDRPRDQWSFGLEPLFGLRDRVTIVDGLAYHSTALDERTDDGHHGGVLHALTASPSVGGTKLDPVAGKQSFHHEIGDYLRSIDPSLTDLASIDALLTDNDAQWAYQSSYVYRDSGSGQIVRPSVEQSPLKVHDMLFDGFTAPETSQPDPFTSRQGDVFAILKERYDRTAKALSSADRRKLEQHRDLIFDLEQRLETQASLAASGECTVPDAPNKQSSSGPQVFDANLEDLTGLLVASMSCGLVRTACVTMKYPDVERLNAGSFVNAMPQGPERWKSRSSLPNEDAHQYYSHGSIPKFEFSTNQNERDRWHAAVPGQARAQRYWMTVAARFAEALDAVPEAGGTMLDNTLIYVANELAHGGHTSNGVPGILIGGAGNHRKGRYVRLARSLPKPWNDKFGMQFAGPPHNKLITGICRDFGMEIDRYGPSQVRGYVQHGVSEDAEQTIDLTGVLSELYG